MKNGFLKIFKNTYTLTIKGKNIERFLHRITNHKIEIYHIKRKKYNEIQITIDKKDYDEILKLKTIYEISISDIHGIIKIKKTLKFHKILLFFLCVQILILLFLTHLIFEIEIVHTDHELRNLLKEELEKYGIKEKNFKKSFQEIQTIKQKILEENKDKIEWLEIENVGTKYIVRVEEREQNTQKKENPPQNIVAKKPGIIRHIEATEGEIVKSKNNYVTTGEVLISGSISLNEEIKENKSAKGKVYAETWYKVTVNYPLSYYEKKYFDEEKEVYAIRFLGKTFELFNFHPWKQKEVTSKTIVKNNLLPISFEKQKQKKIEIIDKTYTKKEAIQEARKAAYKKMKQTLKKDEKILMQKDLKVTEKNSTIELESFFTVYENITAYEEIVSEESAETDHP